MLSPRMQSFCLTETSCAVCHFVSFLTPSPSLSRLATIVMPSLSQQVPALEGGTMNAQMNSTFRGAAAQFISKQHPITHKQASLA